MKPIFEVLVGNIGYVHTGFLYSKAYDVYQEYVQKSEQSFVRASGEHVVLFKDGEVISEHLGRGDK